LNENHGKDANKATALFKNAEEVMNLGREFLKGLK
jgi:hypothetical protein